MLYLSALSLFFALIFFLSSFYPWYSWSDTSTGPGNPMLSPLDRFLLEHYSSWFLVALFFLLGVVAEGPLALAGIYLWKTRTRPKILKHGGFAWKGYKKAEAILGLCLTAPGFVIIVLLYTGGVFYPTLYILGHVVLWLARLRGYQGLYYHEQIASSVFALFVAGVLFVASVSSLYLYGRLKRLVRELKREPKNDQLGQ